MEPTTILKFTRDECDLCIWLLEIEARASTLDVIEKVENVAEKVERIMNGLSGLFFLATLFRLAMNDATATLTLNEMAMKTLATLIRTTSLRNWNDHYVRLFMDNAAGLLRKFEDQSTAIQPVKTKVS
jgi:hypothetical protein